MSKKKRHTQLDQCYDREAEGYDQSRYGAAHNRFRRDCMLRIADSLPNLDAARDVLDVGTGTGLISLHLAHKAQRVFGVDVSEKMLRIAAKKKKENNLPNCFLMRGNAFRLPFADETFDMVTSFKFMWLNWSTEERSFLAGEMKRVLRQGGMLLIGALNPLWAPVFRLPFARKHCGVKRRPMTRHDIKAITNGMRVVAKSGLWMPKLHLAWGVSPRLGMKIGNACMTSELLQRFALELYFLLQKPYTVGSGL